MNEFTSGNEDSHLGRSEYSTLGARGSNADVSQSDDAALEDEYSSPPPLSAVPEEHRLIGGGTEQEETTAEPPASETFSSPLEATFSVPEKVYHFNVTMGSCSSFDDPVSDPKGKNTKNMDGKKNNYYDREYASLRLGNSKSAQNEKNPFDKDKDLASPLNRFFEEKERTYNSALNSAGFFNEPDDADLYDSGKGVDDQPVIHFRRQEPSRLSSDDDGDESARRLSGDEPLDFENSIGNPSEICRAHVLDVLKAALLAFLDTAGKARRDGRPIPGASGSSESASDDSDVPSDATVFTFRWLGHIALICKETMSKIDRSMVERQLRRGAKSFADEQRAFLKDLQIDMISALQEGTHQLVPRVWAVLEDKQPSTSVLSSVSAQCSRLLSIALESLQKGKSGESDTAEDSECVAPSDPTSVPTGSPLREDSYGGVETLFTSIEEVVHCECLRWWSAVSPVLEIISRSKAPHTLFMWESVDVSYNEDAAVRRLNAARQIRALACRENLQVADGVVRGVLVPSAWMQHLIQWFSLPYLGSSATSTVAVPGPIDTYSLATLSHSKRKLWVPSPSSARLSVPVEVVPEYLFNELALLFGCGPKYITVGPFLLWSDLRNIPLPTSNIAVVLSDNTNESRVDLENVSLFSTLLEAVQEAHEQRENKKSPRVSERFDGHDWCRYLAYQYGIQLSMELNVYERTVKETFGDRSRDALDETIGSALDYMLGKLPDGVEDSNARKVARLAICAQVVRDAQPSGQERLSEQGKIGQAANYRSSGTNATSQSVTNSTGDRTPAVSFNRADSYGSREDDSVGNDSLSEAPETNSDRGTGSASPFMVPTRVQPPSCVMGMCGLTNIGNTCYMNSALQCLSNLTPFRRALMRVRLSEYANAPVTSAFVKLLRNMWGGVSSCAQTRDLKNVLGAKERRFSNFEQQDSIELIEVLLDIVHEELNAVVAKKYRERLDSDASIPVRKLSEIFWDNFMLNNQSIVAPLFFHQTKTHFQCLTCKEESIVFENNATLSVPLEKSAQRVFLNVTVVFASEPVDDPPYSTISTPHDNESASHKAAHVGSTVAGDAVEAHIPTGHVVSSASGADNDEAGDDDDDDAASPRSGDSGSAVPADVVETTADQYTSASGHGSEVTSASTTISTKVHLCPAIQPTNTTLVQASIQMPTTDTSNPDMIISAVKAALYPTLRASPSSTHVNPTSKVKGSDKLLSSGIAAKLTNNEISNFSGQGFNSLENKRNTNHSDSTDDIPMIGDDEVIMVTTSKYSASWLSSNGGGGAGGGYAPDYNNSYFSGGGGPPAEDIVMYVSKRRKVATSLPPAATVSVSPEREYEESYTAAGVEEEKEDGEEDEAEEKSGFTFWYFVKNTISDDTLVFAEKRETWPGWRTVYGVASEIGTRFLQKRPAGASNGFSNFNGPSLPYESENIYATAWNASGSAVNSTNDLPNLAHSSDADGDGAGGVSAAAAAAAPELVTPENMFIEVQLGMYDFKTVTDLFEDPAPTRYSSHDYRIVISCYDTRVTDTKPLHTIPHSSFRASQSSSSSYGSRSYTNNYGSNYVMSLEDCLEAAQKPEVLDGDDTWYCPRCKQFQRSEVVRELFSLPSCLMVCLQRFEKNRTALRKNNALVTFPNRLDFGSLISMDSPYSGSTDFQLRGVVYHRGTLNYGHYTARAYNVEVGRWGLFDDSHVTENESSPDVKPPEDSAYLLFYERIPRSIAKSSM